MTKHDNSADDPNYVQIGRVVKPHGVRGEFVVLPTTDDPEGRFAVGSVVRAMPVGGRQRRNGGSQKSFTLTVASVRGHQGRIIMKVEEIPDRNAAESLRGVRFVAEPVIDHSGDEFYDFELEGLHVLTVGPVSAEEAHARAYEGAQPEPEDIGIVKNVLRGPAQRLLEVEIESDDAESAEAESDGAPRTVLIPFVQAIVPIVDIDNEAIVVTPPEGLLELP